MSHPNKKRLRRSMMFLNCQKPGLIKDPYIYGPDSIMLDLEGPQWRKTRRTRPGIPCFTPTEGDRLPRCGQVVRINGLDLPTGRKISASAWQEGLTRFGLPRQSGQRTSGQWRSMCWRQRENLDGGGQHPSDGMESCHGVNALEICEASDRLIGIALSGGDYTKDLQTVITGTGVELMGARQHMIMAARAAGVQCFDTVFTNLDDMEGFARETEMIKRMGFDGKSLVNPRQIAVVHQIFTPTQKEIIFAEKVVREIDEKKAKGIGVFTVDGKMIDIAFYDGARRTLALAKASGVYEGDL